MTRYCRQLSYSIERHAMTRFTSQCNPLWQGGIILGIGGDNSHGAVGTFYEGVMTSGYSSNETDAAVHANIVAAGYGR